MYRDRQITKRPRERLQLFHVTRPELGNFAKLILVLFSRPISTFGLKLKTRPPKPNSVIACPSPHAAGQEG